MATLWRMTVLLTVFLLGAARNYGEDRGEIPDNRQQSQRGRRQQSDRLAGLCHPDNYTTIDDIRRGTNTRQGRRCDIDLQPGWYRFLLDARSAVVPSTCPPTNRCHTRATIWMDLQGQSLPSVGQQRDARACTHWLSDCCMWEGPLTVHNCGHYFIYHLQGLYVCNAAFCVTFED